MKAISITTLLLFSASVAGCAASMPPPELVSARTVADRAEHGPAAQVDPTDLHTAQETLNKAEVSFQNNGDSQETRDVAYAAQRRFETAEARARMLMATAQRERTLAEMNAAQGEQVRSTSMALGEAKQELQGERLRREAAEKRAAQSAADLARLGAVKQEVRGIVLTLSGSVLFVTGKSDLLPTAQVKLNEIAQVLTQTDPDSKIVVEGYTDSQGPATLNKTLSQARAQAVRDYLVAHGVAQDRLSAIGHGPENPVADNTSAEGRANNRRVEIVVQPAVVASR